MEYLLMVGALCLTVSKNMLSKGGRDNFRGFSNLINLNILNGVVATTIFASFGISFSALSSPLLIILALCFALTSVLCSMTQITAMRYGSAAAVTTIFSAGFIITTVYCAIAFNEPISWLSAVGMALLIVSIVAVVYKKSEEKKKVSYKFLFFAVVSMIMSGLAGIIQKYFTFKFEGLWINEYLFVAFALMTIISSIIRRFYNPREIVSFKKRAFILPAIFYALVYAGLNKLNLYLTGVIDGVIFFPFLNGGAIGFTALFSFVIFKEKLNLRQWIGIFFCIISIILVAIG